MSCFKVPLKAREVSPLRRLKLGWLREGVKKNILFRSEIREHWDAEGKKHLRLIINLGWLKRKGGEQGAHLNWLNLGWLKRRGGGQGALLNWLNLGWLKRRGGGQGAPLSWCKSMTSSTYSRNKQTLNQSDDLRIKTTEKINVCWRHNCFNFTRIQDYKAINQKTFF